MWCCDRWYLGMKIKICLIITISLFVSSLAYSSSRPFPKPQGAVNDFASVIPLSEKVKMENLCRELLEKTGTSIVIVTLESIDDDSIEEYANKLYQKWGIGKKGEDKGVLFLLALKERKVRIETGYGVEGILPDGLVGEILDKEVVPYLRERRYSDGLYNGLLKVAWIVAKDAGVEISGEPGKIKPPGGRRDNSLSLISLIFLLLFLFIIFGPTIWPWLFLSGMSRRHRRYWSGGEFSGFGGGFGSFGGGFGGFGGGLSGGGGASRGF